MYTVEYILNSVYDPVNGNLRTESGSGTVTEATTIQEILNAVYNPTNKTLYINGTETVVQGPILEE